MHLEWRRPVDGVDLVDDPIEVEEGAFLARSDRFEPISFRSSNLEDPLCLRLINCREPEDFQKFINRFGFPQHLGGNDRSCWVRLIKWDSERLEDLLQLSHAENSMRRGNLANELLQHTSLHPTFEFSEATNRNSLVIRPGSLSDLMAMEASFALEEGAVLTRCAQCSKAYLTGPLTGRRSHSVYCSDRCRVAAMRVRNAAKGDA